MQAKIVSFIKNNLLLIALSLVSVITILPLLKYGTQAVFYKVDPDVVYVGNAIAYVKSHIIFFDGHPGTPVIVFLGLSYWPLQVYAKLVAHQSFIAWSFDNLRFLFMYSRLIIFLVFSLSIFIYLSSIKVLTKSASTILFAWFGLFFFGSIFGLGSKISAESGIFFIVPFWLLIFSIYLKDRRAFYVFLMAVIAGVGEAAKVNSLVLFFSTILIAFFWGNTKLWQRIRNVLLVALLCITSFFISTWPIRASFKPELTRFVKVAQLSGVDGAHGSGNSHFINFREYVPNLLRIAKTNTISFYIIIGTTIIVAYLLMRKRMKTKDPIFLVFISALLSFMILLKYNLIYYQLPNYLVLVFLASYFFGKFNTPAKLLLIFLLTFPLISALSRGFQAETASARSAAFLEENISEHPARIATLWDFGPTRDFAYIWIRSWVPGTFNEEIAAKRPDLLELDADYERVYKNSYGEPFNIWKICWDKLYIRRARAEEFLSKYSAKHFDTIPIGDGAIWEIDSNHCLSN